VFASAEGANGRIAMGTSVVGGMIISSLLTLFVIPSIYLYLSTDRKRSEIIKRAKRIRFGQ
jgi:multidrug efflux pump